MEAKLILFFIPHAGSFVRCESGVFTKKVWKGKRVKEKRLTARWWSSLCRCEKDAGGKLIPYGICNISPSFAPYENLDWNGKVLKDNAGTSEWTSEQRRERNMSCGLFVSFKKSGAFVYQELKLISGENTELISQESMVQWAYKIKNTILILVTI